MMNSSRVPHRRCCARAASDPYQAVAANATAANGSNPNSGAPKKAATKVKRPDVRSSGAKCKGKVARRVKAYH